MNARRRVPRSLLILILLLLATLQISPFTPQAIQPVTAAQPRADLIGVSGNAFTWEPQWPTFSGLLGASNVGWARLELRWDYIHPTPTTWNWSLYDDLVNGYTAQGIKPLGLLAYSVGWASGQGGSQPVFGPPTDMDAWEDYVHATALHFKGRITAWEVWNEPDVAFFWNGKDGGDPVVYFEMLKRAHRAIKAADPDAIVMNGGLTGTERGATYMQRLLDLGAADYLDAVAFHGYVSVDGLDTHVYPEIIWPLVSKARERAGKPLWITEFGWSSGCASGSVACSETLQANRIARNLAMLFRLGGVERVFVFQFKDPDSTPYYGLTHADGRIKPAYTAVATIAERLAGLTFERQVDFRVAGVWAMRFTSPGRTVDIIWSQNGERDITYPTGRSQVRTWDLRGERRDYATAQGGVTLRIGADPLIVERDGQAPAAGGPARCRYFAETQQSLCDGFLDFWERHGGLMRFGYPISGELLEAGRTVQYLERMKFEYHPEAFGTDWAVLGELIGRTITRGREQEAPFRPLTNLQAEGAGSNCTPFAETGHRLCDGFRTYWQANGGLWMFGYPISEAFSEVNPDDGRTYTVQYFERARFEWRPENAGTPYVVLLGRLGAQLYEERY